MPVNVTSTPLPKELSIPLQQYVLLLQNGENQDLESIPRRSKSQLSQPGKRKGYPDSQSSDERPWLDSPLDTDDITVQVPPPVPVSSYSFIFLLDCSLTQLCSLCVRVASVFPSMSRQESVFPQMSNYSIKVSCKHLFLALA